MQLPSFDEFIEKHGDYLKLMLLEEILSKSPKRISKDEEKKIERTIEIAIDAAKKLAEVYGNPEKLVHVGLMKINHAKDALSILEFLNPEKSPLEVIGDHIIELKKMHPEVVKPEKVYGKEWYEFLKKKGIDPKTLEPIGKKPTFPKMKEQVEEELRKAGVPEQQIKVVAPRLATAVWLENQIRALKESTPARLYGGVPVAELRNLREKVLAKKHVAEKAAEIIENYWMKGTIVPIREEHLDPKMLPFVREHASGMMEDIKNLAERVKSGELDPQDVRNILAIERDLLDRTHEAIEKTMGNPENLIENRRAYGVEDKFMVKGEALEKMHRELKPHFETARVRVFIRGGSLEFKEL